MSSATLDVERECKRYEQLFLASPVTPTRRTRDAYASLVSAIASDGLTIARAFGGSGWASVQDPEPYASLAELYSAARYARGPNVYSPVSVSNVNHNGAFLGDDRANLAFRAHHDAMHVLLYAGFDLGGECFVAYETAKRLMTFGSDASTVIVAEIVGQGLYHAVHGKFPLVGGKQPVAAVNTRTQRWSRYIYNEIVKARCL
jgi:hypothetical protein